MLEVNESFAIHCPKDSSELFDWVMSLDGETVRKVEKRHTFRIAFGEEVFFVKQHYGVMWKEAVKDVLRLKRPVLGADNEYRISKYLLNIGISCAEPVAVGVSGPLWRRRSFLVTEALPETLTLNQIATAWRDSPPDVLLKRVYIEKVACIVRQMHSAGINHRDLYINHFRVPVKFITDKDAPIYLMDLHRAQKNRAVSRRWLIKDLGSLLYSCLDKPFSRTDWIRFVKHYRSGSGQEIDASSERRFWAAVLKKAMSIKVRQDRRSSV